MTQPRYEFWRPITPVIGEPIPDGAQYCSGEPGEGEWFFFGMAYPQNFAASHMRLPWRAPVEVIPLDVAVRAILDSLTGVGEFTPGDGYEAVAEHLRKAAK